MSLPQPVRGLKRAVCVVLAGLFFALAVLGVILPGLPTTPFLLLTSYFLIRSSDRLHKKLLASKRFGPLLRDWHEHRALRPRVKIFSLVACAATVTAATAFGGLRGWAAAAVLAAGVTGIVYVARIPVIRRKNKNL